MKRNTAGLGSSLVVLAFTTLCLTIFSLISLSAANVDKQLAEAEAKTVTAYYEADLLAERVLSQIIESETAPVTVMGVDISWSEGKAAFSCPISDNKELYVEVEITEGSYEIIQWRMRDTMEWERDSGLPVWSGEM